MDRLEPMTYPFSGVQVIEASAGTGKTWTIEALYLRLLLGHGGLAPLRPDHILVVTFTNAATDELRRRIRERMNQAIACFRGAPSTDPVLLALRETYPPEQHEQRAVDLELAMQWMDEAAIHTIHAWCSQVLRRHPLAGKALGELEIQDNDDLLIEVVRDYWRVHCLNLPEQEQAVLAKHKTPDALLHGIKLRIRGTEGTEVPLLEHLRRARAPMLTALAEIKQRVAQSVDDFAAALAGHAKLKGANLKRWLESARAWSEEPGVADTETMRLTLKNITPEKAGIDHPFLQALEDAQSLAEKYQDADLGHLFAHAAAWCAPRLEDIKQRRGIAGSDDLVRRVAAALTSPQGEQLAAQLRERFPAAMVDEFQDTDRTQWAIFRSLYQGQATASLTLIGDPKQSIYGFRGADIDTYLQAKRSADRVYRLDTNFRSTEALVRAVNRVFSHADRLGGGAFLHADDIPFIEMKANGLARSWSPAMTIWTSEIACNGDDNRARMAAACAQGIVQLLHDQVPPQDIAVLVRGWREAEAVRWALGRRKVRSVYLSERDSVFASQEARDILTLLDACAHPRDDRRVRAAFALPLLHRPLQELAALTEDELALESLMKRFLDYHALWQERGVLSLLYRIAHDHTLLDSGADDRALTNYLHLADLLQNEAAGLEGEHALIRVLKEHIDGSGAGSGSEAHTVRLESDDEVVRVVTIHKSKGLEYPFVFLPFATGPRGEAKEDEADETPESQRLLYVALTRAKLACWIGATATLHNRGNATHRSLLGYTLSGGELIHPGQLQASLEALRDGSDDIVIAQLPEPDQRDAPHTGRREMARPALHYSGARRPSWWIGSYSALQLGPQRHYTPESATEELLVDAVADDVVESASVDESIHRMPRGADTGNFLHGLLEWAAAMRFDQAAEDDAARLVEITRRCRHRFDPNWIPVLDRWLKALLVTDWPLGGAAVSLRALRTYKSELEFFFGARAVDAERVDALVTRHILPGQRRPGVVAGTLTGMMKGFIDLVLEHDGQYFVADFKSNALGDDDSAYTTTAMAAQILKKRYDLQFTLYTLALHRLLKLRLGAGYDYDKHVGGAVYLFLRGIHEPAQHGVFALKPPRELIEQLDALFDGKEVRDVA